MEPFNFDITILRHQMDSKAAKKEVDLKEMMRKICITLNVEVIASLGSSFTASRRRLGDVNALT